MSKSKTYIEVLDSKIVGKKYRNSWNGKLYRTVEAGKGVRIELCDSESVNDNTVVGIEIK